MNKLMKYQTAFGTIHTLDFFAETQTEAEAFAKGFTNQINGHLIEITNLD